MTCYAVPYWTLASKGVQIPWYPHERERKIPPGFTPHLLCSLSFLYLMSPKRETEEGKRDTKIQDIGNGERRGKGKKKTLGLLHRTWKGKEKTANRDLVHFLPSFLERFSFLGYIHASMSWTKARRARGREREGERDCAKRFEVSLGMEMWKRPRWCIAHPAPLLSVDRPGCRCQAFL
ncbi:hypothetical protein KC332_g43 [Hortaea werneckii]|nr:hypothetical protein KC332_g43 [Hortaea werneckii]